MKGSLSLLLDRCTQALFSDSLGDALVHAYEEVQSRNSNWHPEPGPLVRCASSLSLSLGPTIESGAG